MVGTDGRGVAAAAAKGAAWREVDTRAAVAGLPTRPQPALATKAAIVGAGGERRRTEEGRDVADTGVRTSKQAVAMGSTRGPQTLK